MSTNIILNHQEINHKLNRIAHQIYEANINEEQVVLAGIDKNGFILGGLLKEKLEEISELDVIICKVIIDKLNPLEEIKTSLDISNYENKSIILIDDVLNSGATLIYGVKHFLSVSLKRFKTVVLVNRNHKKYPVKADFKGISLSTSLNEHVTVSLKKNNYEVTLS
jgi:pyrimidine operon attenuation protein/uracil phosphoribosyltransferase